MKTQANPEPATDASEPEVADEVDPTSDAAFTSFIYDKEHIQPLKSFESSDDPFKAKKEALLEYLQSLKVSIEEILYKNIQFVIEYAEEVHVFWDNSIICLPQLQIAGTPSEVYKE